jgi:signal transduction histidine kinase
VDAVGAATSVADGAIGAALAHDIGHELALVSYLVSTVRRDPAIRPDNRRRLEVVDREVARLQELIGLGAEDTTEAPVSLSAVVADVVDPLALSGPTTVVTTSTDDVRVRVDGRALWRLLANLVGNAVRAAGPGGTVRVRVLDRPWPAVEVHDDGPGPDAGPAGHRGLGLAIATDLAARCGADLSLAPAEGGGAVARVAFGARARIVRPGHARELLHTEGA